MPFSKRLRKEIAGLCPVLVQAWHRPVRAFVGALILGSQDIDDVAQEVFLRVIERLDRVAGVDALGPFLRGVARNVVRERQRKYARESRAYERFIADRFESAASREQESWLADPELLTTLRRCLSGLPDRSREMLSLRYEDRLTSDEIGQLVGLNGPAVRTALRRARTGLLKCIRSSYAAALDATPLGHVTER